MGALVIGRRPGRSILIGEHRLTLLNHGNFTVAGHTARVGMTVSLPGPVHIQSSWQGQGHARFRIVAPREIKILREELLNENQTW